MQREYFLNAVVGLSVVAMVAAVSQRLSAQEVEKKIHRIVVAVGGEVETPDPQATDAVRDGEVEGRGFEPVAASPYWIGANCTEADEALRNQLSLDKGRGLVVQDVVADSPAAKAGLKKYDVIVSIGGQPVGKASELVKAVNTPRDSDLKLGIVRTGKSETISVKPEKRKDGNKLFIYNQSPVNVRMVQPGMVLPWGARFATKTEPFHADLPADMTVTITKQGKETAKIAIKQGDKSWETTADKMGELPEDVRKQIEPMMMMALQFPHVSRDVITWVPDTLEIQGRVRDAAERVKRETEQIRARAGEAGEQAREKAKRLLDKAEALRESAQSATEEKAAELRAAAEKLHRAAGEAIENSGAVERGRNFFFKRLDGVEQQSKSDEALKSVQDLLERRFNELQKEIDSLRKNVEELKADAKEE